VLRVAGVDGCRAGWVAIVLEDGGFARAGGFASFAALLAATADCAAIAVDMPIGLVARGLRDCDRLAQAALAGRRSTLFTIPCREVLELADYAAANALSRRLDGRGISKQAHNLRAKILEVDAHAGDPRVHEVHPELSFLELAAGAALLPKKTFGGHSRRRELLAAAGITLPAALGGAERAAPDDVLDAAAAAWTADRIARGLARRLPPDGPRAPAIWI